MLNVNKQTGNIEIVRGDSFTLSLYINMGTELNPKLYTLGPNDTIYFALLEPNQMFEEAVVKKVITNENLQSDNTLDIVFESTDTCNLAPGKYYYQIKGAFKNIEENKTIVNTLVNKKIFNILE